MLFRDLSMATTERSEWLSLFVPRAFSSLLPKHLAYFFPSATMNNDCGWPSEWCRMLHWSVVISHQYARARRHFDHLFCAVRRFCLYWILGHECLKTTNFGLQPASVYHSAFRWLLPNYLIKSGKSERLACLSMMSRRYWNIRDFSKSLWVVCVLLDSTQRLYW